MLVLGIDAGGTASRALVTTLDGTRVGFGRAGAGNPVAVPLSSAVAAVSAAVASALSDVDPARIGAAVVGMAGSSRLSDPAAAAAFGDLGLPVAPHFVGDVVVAFAAGTAALDGTVVISGTGAVAARIIGGAQGPIADGLGWLLGDLGSGFWIGREAAAHTARALYANCPSLLSRAVAAAVGLDDPDAFVIALQDRPIHELARLAPLVTDAALAGDSVALSIVETAAAHLASTASSIHEGGPIVLAGSVLRNSAPIRDAVLRLLADRWPSTEIVLAEPGEVGAARLAARFLTMSRRGPA